MEEVLDWKEFNSHHLKVIRTIKSCRTIEQLDGAARFTEFMIRFHLHKMMESPKAFRKKYQETISESHELIQKALSTKKTLLKYEK